MVKRIRIAFGCLLAVLLVATWDFVPARASDLLLSAYRIVQNAGSNLPLRTTINFHGAGVTASDSGGVTDVNIPGGVSSGGYDTVQDEGTPLTMRTVLNCTGAGITCSDDSMNMVTLINVPGGGTPTTVIWDIGASFDGGGSAITSGETTYYRWVHGACTINAWNVQVDTGTITIDVWKVPSGTAIPTIANTITGSATPAIAANTAVHSTTLTGWTTSVAHDDIFGVSVTAISGATTASLDVECTQI